MIGSLSAALPTRRQQRARLKTHQIQITHSRLRPWDGLADSLASVTRHPGRSLLSGTGTAVGVAALVATVGLIQTAQQQVSSEFDALSATQVSLKDSQSQLGTPLFDTTAQVQSAEARIMAMPGVVNAGVVWPLGADVGLPVRTTMATDPTGIATTNLPFTAATPRAMEVMNVQLVAGRRLNQFDVDNNQAVAVLGAPAARQLGISNLAASPAIFIGPTALTVVGIIQGGETQAQALLGVMVPPNVASTLTSGGTPSQQVIVKVEQGAADVVGRSAALAATPYQPERVDVLVPPDPRSLRASVSQSVSGLLTLLGLVSLGVGIVSITSATLLSVLQRSGELGLRRALGARPRHIAVLVIVESAFVGTLGGLIGALTGIIATSATSAVREWAPVINPAVPLLAPIVGTMTGVLAGLYPAWRAVRTAPASSMRQSL